MDIFETIIKDHSRQRQLMSSILNTSDESERARLFQEFCVEFEAHAAAEEHAFYAPMLESQETTDQSRHSVAEHQSALELIERLQNTEINSLAWMALFKQLADENEHHMHEEEDEVFALVKETMSESDHEEMLRTFKLRKNSELSHQ